MTPSIISKFRDKFKDVVRGNTLNRKLDVVSTMFTTWRKEWGFPVDNPVLSIRRPKNSEPRDRRFTDEEINLLLRGNWTLGANDKDQADQELKEELKKLIPKNLTQKAMADDLDISVGKVNKLIKEIEKK